MLAVAASSTSRASMVFNKIACMLESTFSVDFARGSSVGDTSSGDTQDFVFLRVGPVA